MSSSAVPGATAPAVESAPTAPAIVEPAEPAIAEVPLTEADGIVAPLVQLAGAALAAPGGGLADAAFYAGLEPIGELRDVLDGERHTRAPLSWLLVRIRVEGAEAAIEAGRYRDVNALGVAAIVAACNAVRGADLPYSFSGDGALLLAPSSEREALERALRGARAMARAAFDLGLRASIIPLAELAAAGHTARVAPFRPSPGLRLAAFSGSACRAAELWLDDPERAPGYEVGDAGESGADFDGFECRWQPQASQRGHTVSLIVRALGPTDAERTQTYRSLWHAFERIVDTSACSPVKAGELSLSGWLGDYSVEARVRSRGPSGPAYAAARRSARKQTLLGKLLTASGMSAGGFDGRRYKRQLAEHCVYLEFEDALRLVVDLNVAEIYRLESRLAAEHRAGRLAYGLHRSSATLITCFVRSYSGDHVHFVDGAEGGWALAARQLAAQLQELAARGGKGPDAWPRTRAARTE